MLMKYFFLKLFLFIAIFFFFVPSQTSAHQPRLVDQPETQVIDPEISKAYYGELNGQPHTYDFTAEKDFNLYVGILVPEDAEKNVSALIYKDEQLLATLGGEDAQWKTFFEPFGQSMYWDGGEYKLQSATAGDYTIVVSNPKNVGKYSLAIGEVEAFDFHESWNALKVIPLLKRDFFKESPISFIKSPFGWGYIIMTYLIAFIFGFTFRFVMRKIIHRSLFKKHKNINTKGRMIRLAIALGLLIFAIMTTWNVWILLISGFVFFEAVFSWCGWYAIIGNNSCPR